MKRNKEHLFFEYVTSFLDVFLNKQISRSLNTIESYRDSLTVFRRYILNEIN